MSGEEATSLRSALRRQLATWHEVPALVRDRYLTVIAANDLAGALSPAFVEGANLARYTFLEAPAERRTAFCGPQGDQVAAMLRDSVEQHLHDVRFRAIVGELAALSPAFAAVWAAPPVVRPSGEVTLQHERVGELVLSYTELRVPDERDDRLLLWSPVGPSSKSALARLRTRSAG